MAVPILCLTKEEGEIICEVPRKTWLPLRVFIRSSKACYSQSYHSFLVTLNLHRCLKYHGISRVPQERLIENLKLKKRVKHLKAMK